MQNNCEKDVLLIYKKIIEKKLFKPLSAHNLMLKHKRIRERGKISLSRYFQSFRAGDSVAVVRELSLNFGYPHKLQGRTGRIIKRRGSAYEIEIPDLEKKKIYLIKSVHLKKIEDAK